MTEITDFMHRVALEADPSAVYNRANAQDMEDYILLADLVESKASLPESLTRGFLAVMVEGIGVTDRAMDLGPVRTVGRVQAVWL